MSDDVIYRRDAIDAVRKEKNEDFNAGVYMGITIAAGALRRVPAAAEIVHCKDCKHYICHDDDEFPDDQPEWFCHHPELYRDDDYDFAALTMSPDDFCSRGERREDG